MLRPNQPRASTGGQTWPDSPLLIFRTKLVAPVEGQTPPSIPIIHPVSLLFAMGIMASALSSAATLEKADSANGEVDKTARATAEHKTISPMCVDVSKVSSRHDDNVVKVSKTFLQLQARVDSNPGNTSRAE